jgi:hypothetical protein
MNRSLSLSIALVAILALAACGFEHATSVSAPTSTGSGASAPAPNPAPPSSGSTSVVGIWTSRDIQPSLPSPNSCGNFQYQIANQTASSIEGTFTATCGNNLVLSARVSGQVNGNNVSITLDGSGSLQGLPVCTFKLTGNGTIEDNGNTLNMPYSGTTCLGPVQGTEVLRRPQPQAPPAPEPTPPPPPPPPAPSGPSDGLDLRSAVITGGSPADVGSWPITTQITGMDFASNGVRVDFSKKSGAGRWPDVVPPGWDGPIQYTLWMVVNIGGRWYTSGGVEYWYGLERQGGPPSQFAYNWYYSPQVWGPLANHQPANGEQTGFFVTAGDHRVKNVTAVRERSNVVVLPFPSGGGFFRF